MPEVSGDEKVSGPSLEELMRVAERELKAAPHPFWLTEHGWGHTERVLTWASILGQIKGLSDAEMRILREAALFHDIGNRIDRGTHHACSAKMVLQMCGLDPNEIPQECRGEIKTFERLGLPEDECRAVADIVLWHRKKMGPVDMSETRIVGGEVVRTGLLKALLRVADVLDIDWRRARAYEVVREKLPPESVPHWEGHVAIKGEVFEYEEGEPAEIKLFVSSEEKAAFQVGELKKDLAGSFPDWKVETIKMERCEDWIHC